MHTILEGKFPWRPFLKGQLSNVVAVGAACATFLAIIVSGDVLAEGQTSETGYHLDPEANPNAVDEHGQTALHRAAESGDVKSVAALVSEGAGITCQDNNRWTPLHIAEYRGQLPVADWLREHGATSDILNADGLPPTGMSVLRRLHEAAANGRVEEISAILAEEPRFVNGRTPLGRNSFEADVLWSQYMIGRENVPDRSYCESKTRVMPSMYRRSKSENAEQGNAWTPLHQAVFFRRIESVESLLARGADVNARAVDCGWTALHAAASLGCEDVVQELIAHGADCSARDDVGRTPLHVLYLCRNPAIATLLIDNGADVNAVDESGATPLHTAWPESARVLIDRGAGLNARTKSGETPLNRHLNTSNYGNSSTALLLIRVGADVNAADNDGFTPLHWAVKSYHQWDSDLVDAVDEMLKSGADVCARANDGSTPLSMMLNRRCTRLLRLLIPREEHPTQN